MKKENQKLSETLKHSKEINENLLNKIKSYEQLNIQNEERNTLIPILQNRMGKLEKIIVIK